MEDPCGIVPFRDNRVASRKAEEAGLRRYRAAGWLESMVGPLEIPPQPSEAEFVSRLRNGLVLCNLINKIQPGAVPRVINNHSHRLTLEAQPPPAYQYFENIRNFLVAVGELKLPAFEASDLERDTLESGSTSKIVDCILSLKSFHEWKMYSGGNGSCKFPKSPVVLNSSGKFFSHVTSSRSELCGRLGMPTGSKNQETNNEALLIKTLCERVFSSKENIDQNILSSLLSGVSVLPKCLFIQLLHCSWCLGNVNCNHGQILEAQEKELGGMKVLLSKMRTDVLSFHSQLQSDLTQLGSQVQGLSVSALGYSRAMKENRSLYNMLQDLKGSIRVYCRIRPGFDSEVESSIEFTGDDGSLRIADPSKPKDPQKIFQFNKVFPGTATQEEVYRDTQPLIRSVMDGYNVCIFAYGQTGSGKTHTMFGRSDACGADLGINYRALNDLFEISCSRSDAIKYEVRVQMVEIYNDQVRDLLGDDSSSTIEIRSCSGNGGLSLPDAALHAVKYPEDVRRLMRLGESNRVLCSTAINQRSSRSHSVLTVHVHGEEISGGAIYGRLHLVDLAGSERVDKSEVTGERLKEAQHINRSLSCLGDVMAALGQKNSHVPYRNCKLTQLLQDSLGGQAKTLMFAHVSPEADSYEETISTLRFAQRVSRVELGSATRNRESNEVRKLREQVEDLKKAMAAGRRGDVQRSEATTPPCAGQMSSGNRQAADETPNLASKSLTKQTPLRSRRLSLEGGVSHGRNPLPQARVSELTFLLQIRSSIPGPPSEEGQRPLPEEVCFSSQSRIPRLENGSRSTLQARTPEFSRNMAAETLEADGGLSWGQPRSRVKDVGSRGSQIRKSLQTFGRLINGDNRRSPRSIAFDRHLLRRNHHQNPPEKPSPVSRRQSLVSLPTPGARASRRSSLGGNPVPAETTSRRQSVGRCLCHPPDS
ncbi:unnamed protein product [Spirodela intermedia]|uniref:Kinesin-like protein n=1 Tax=Spirodela intermedia TaxID=51605 RepID=A0A7I8LEM7_SPIIN|nr:unnamed protein product [Spirodela intermedia]